jgi:hypothetical protein
MITRHNLDILFAAVFCSCLFILARDGASARWRRLPDPRRSFRTDWGGLLFISSPHYLLLLSTVLTDSDCSIGSLPLFHHR